MEENRNTHTIHEDGKIGEVQIADDVVAIIAGLAATEVEGVAAMYGNITNELVSKLGMKNLSKGVKAVVTEDGVHIDLALNVTFGYNIKDVSLKVQEKVKSAIETMTGLEVICVNIRIANIAVEQNH
ncbi:MAG: Asp23/Gls24 family envelope stress response protein [Lachnospiraceae bacterium]|nr:Asp23/Gls24 family envelope stress response protein [Lachnospiraceae bacterium]